MAYTKVTLIGIRCDNCDVLYEAYDGQTGFDTATVAENVALADGWTKHSHGAFACQECHAALDEGCDTSGF